MDEIMTPVIGDKELLELTRILAQYKSGKAITEQRIISAENWWKLRNTREEKKDSAVIADDINFKSRSGWLHNVITSKHADAMEAYPAPIIRPREEGDKAEAEMLSAILPCVLEANDFEAVYDEIQSQKLKFGTGIYKVVWDATKLNGLGDISITRVSPLNIFVEPGVEDIQKSRYVFHTELVDKDSLLEQYPELDGKVKNDTFIASRFQTDDTVPANDKVTVIDVYYHKRGRLHYIKFVQGNVIYASENDPERAERGFYDHGLYPYVFDTLYKVEGSPFGYGYVDLCRNPQTAIDLMNTSFVKNAMVGATPRYFCRTDGSVNMDQFLDLTKPLVHTDGNLGEDSIRLIQHTPLDGNYVACLDRFIQELRETSGNTETSTGSTSAGVTAASAIAALQEASGKGSRDANKGSYRAFCRVQNLVIELFRQFYDMPRSFRILGQNGAERFVSYTNAGLQPQAQGMAFGVDLGYRLPVFDISCAAQKKNVFTTVAQNELALQFYNLGFFRPDNADQALMTMEMMDFDGKDELMAKISQQGTMFQKLVQYQQLALMLAQKYEPGLVHGLSQDIMGGLGAPKPQGNNIIQMPQSDGMAEPTIVRNARERSANAAAPDEGGVVTRREQ